jgi:hypothetical protein
MTTQYLLGDVSAMNGKRVVFQWVRDDEDTTADLSRGKTSRIA